MTDEKLMGENMTPENFKDFVLELERDNLKNLNKEDKKNLFGYGAYDSNPYGGAYSFGTYAEGIDLVARMLVKYYLNPAGTIIYEGEVASGSYYNGPTLTGVNTRYASDPNWANAVFKWMQYLYDRL